MLEGEFRLTPRERTELKDRMRSRTLPAEDARRARLILLLAQGKSYLTIRQQLGCNPNYISRWKGRFEAERLAGLYSRHRPPHRSESAPRAALAQLPHCLHAARTRTQVVRCFPKAASLHPSPPPHPLPFDHAARAATITSSKNRQPRTARGGRAGTNRQTG